MSNEPNTTTEDTMTAAQTAEVTNLPVVRQRAEVRVVEDVIPVLDTARFEHMQRIARAMAYASLIPDGLKGPDIDVTQANCFLVVNQAVRWEMDPFAVAQCVSVINGKILHEGKLIAAVIEKKLGIRLKAEWAGDGERMSIKVSGMIDGTLETVEGSVADWKTVRAGSPWVPKQYRKMLWYRGVREWCRFFASGLILGVYSPDEMDDLADDARARRAHHVEALNAPEPTEPTSTASTTTEATDATTGEVVWTEEGERPATGQDAPEPDAPTTGKAEPAKVETKTETKPETTKTKRGERVAPVTSVMSAAGKPIENALAKPEEWVERCKAAAAKATTFAELKAAGDSILEGQDARVTPDVWEAARSAFGARETEIADAAKAAAKPAFDAAQWLKDLDGAFGGCEDVGELVAAQAKYMTPHKGDVDGPTYEKASKLAVAAFARISGA